jgi:hypothetical protein
MGTGYLKPVYEELGGAVNYDDLKTLRLYYLVNRKDNQVGDTGEDG